MYRVVVVRLSCLVFGLLFVTALQAQPAPADKADAPSVEIIYTGKLLGYFRSPSLQPATLRSCPGRSRTGDSPAATQFLNERGKHAAAILVGTGDNFSPQLEARVFTPAPTREKSRVQSNYYEPGNKELYNWNPSADSINGHWLFYQETDKPEFKDLKDRLARGVATIPVDNVGCFLAEARFAAVVPGKHDFYFGAERVRQLARFMAGLVPTEDTRGLQKNEGPNAREEQAPHPPQMLGANLVIKTTRVDGSPADLTRPSAVDKWKWPKGVTLLNFKEGTTVYPWLSVIRVQSEGDLSTSTFFVCQLTGDVDQKIGVSQPNCRRTAVRPGDGNSKYEVIFAAEPGVVKGKDGHFATLQPGENYALCINNSEGDSCIPFSVYVPFFTYPRAVASTTDLYTDPDPYVLVANDKPENETAIFGVVDKTLGERVGILNFSWGNFNDELQTVVSVEDPAEALRQQLDYFHERYNTRHGRKFSGLKILLAQMSPQLARVFAARFPEFQIVVSAADDEQATPEITQETTWTAMNGRGAFVAAPYSSFDAKEGTARVSLGTISASPVMKAKAAGEENAEIVSWRLNATANAPDHLEKAALEKGKQTLCSATKQTFREYVSCALERFMPKDEITKLEDAARVKWLTLWAIRERTGADVAFLQKRDLFYDFKEPLAPNEFQQALDRMIWKGDLLSLLYVKGSAIKAALDASKKFTQDDSNLLSLSDEKLRGLEYLGIALDGDQYVINEAPLDEAKVYAVATTDYIGAGDTGYPAFALSALNPKTRASQFPEKLDIISGVVCRQLFDNPADADKYCLARLTREEYLDRSTAKGPAKKPSNPLGPALDSIPFNVSGESKLKDDPIQEAAQEKRAIWLFSLKNASFTFAGLSNNMTDEEIEKSFAGVPASGVTSKRSQNIKLGLDLRISRSSHSGENFLATGIDFHRESLGDEAGEKGTVVSQKRNRATGEVGRLWNLRGGRWKRRLGLNSSVYFETQLMRPFTDFELGTSDRKEISQDRSLQILPRIGLRLQNGVNIFEAGFQAGWERNALRGYRFDSGAECLPNPAETFAACIKRQSASTSPPPVITKDSVATPILETRPRAGFYVKSNWSVPIFGTAKYEVTHRGDYFFTLNGDSTADTRYWDESKHSIKWPIFPSLSIGPSVRLLFYRNKKGTEWLWQREIGFETTFTFDWFNRREKKVQIRNKP